MNKLEIMKESFNYRGAYIKEDYLLTKFVKGFNEDQKYFGKDTANLYKVLFGLNEEIDFLVEHQEEINEEIKSNKRPFLFESVMDKGNNYLFEAPKEFWWDTTETGHSPLSLLKKKQKIKEIQRDDFGGKEIAAFDKGGKDLPTKEIQRDAFGGKEVAAFDKEGRDLPISAATTSNIINGKEVTTMQSASNEISTNNIADANFEKIRAAYKSNPEQFKPLKNRLETAAEADTPQEAMKILQSDNVGFGSSKAAIDGATSIASGDHPVAAAASAAKSVAKTAAAPAKEGFLAHLLSGIGNAWNNVKKFFGGGVTSIGSAVSKGDFGALLHIPLVQGSLAVGGTVLAFKLLKKLFGNKIKDEGKLKAALAGAR